MKKSYNVEETFNNMRIDRWLRKNLGELPQSFIEKNLRNGKIKINNKKVKSSYKVNTNEKIELNNFSFKATIIKKKIKFQPTKDIIKSKSNMICIYMFDLV